MHVGTGVIFQNPENHRSDHEVYRQDLRLALLTEPLGFQSIWGVEHHFTDYTMTPDVLQFLTYMAGATRTIHLGSMVVVLPWHNPMRVAEQVSVLDHLSEGRLVLGLGRGLGRIEFEGLGVPMEESRGRFVESATMLLEGLERGWCESKGEYIRQPRRDIRPRPFKSFRGRSYAAAVSPDSVPIIARLGLGVLVIPQKPWEAVAEDLAVYDRVFREVNGVPPPAPIAAGWVFCDASADRAEELARKYIGGYWRTVMKHYELEGEHLQNLKGYESYGKLQEMVTAEGGAEAMIDFFLGLQIWGTPDQCYARILEVRRRIGAEWFNGVFSYAAMPAAEAERNMRLFAREVMPELQRLPPLAAGVEAVAAAS
jgi:alkanesulfonate monooxygenase SsuD/methylene tetrahydromethanopterin reductase-like flavin-dependent oxidoreductase (luciferase family)